MISIITPVYNGDKYLSTCIQNVIDQNCPDIEHIIIDGGSKDKTIGILENYSKKFSHIRWVSEKDKGQSDAINKGIAKAKGEIIAILNVDDYYEPGTLNRILELFQGLPEPSFIVGNCNVWDNAGNLMFTNKPRRLDLPSLLLGFSINQFPVNPSAYFYHASLHQKIGLFKVDEHYAMDLDFIFRAVQHANLKYVDAILGNFCMFEGSKTVNDFANQNSHKRKDTLFRHYRKDLSFIQRLNVTVLYEGNRAWLTLKHFTENPNSFLEFIKKKVFLEGS